MNNSKITTVVFDFGGVLIDWNPRHLYRKLFQSDQEVEWFLENVCTSEWNVMQDAGRPFEIAIDERKEKYPSYSKEIEAYFHRWREMVTGEIQGSKEVLISLKSSGYNVYGLTNWSDQTFSIIPEEFDILNFLDGVVVSGKEGVVKPDPDIYQLLIDRYDIDPASSVFIDDSKSNIDVAQSLGFHTIHFKSSDQMKSELNDLGVRVD